MRAFIGSSDAFAFVFAGEAGIFDWHSIQSKPNKKTTTQSRVQITNAFEIKLKELLQKAGDFWNIHSETGFHFTV